VVRPRSCRVIYYFDTPTLGRRHQSFGRVNSEPKCTNKKWIVILTPWLLSHFVLNVWIMVYGEVFAHRLMKCICLQRPNHHIGRGQSLLILTTCIWNEERPSLLFLSHSKKYIPCGPFLSLNNFSYMKNPD